MATVHMETLSVLMATLGVFMITVGVVMITVDTVTVVLCVGSWKKERRPQPLKEIARET